MEKRKEGGDRLEGEREVGGGGKMDGNWEGREIGREEGTLHQ